MNKFLLLLLVLVGITAAAILFVQASVHQSVAEIVAETTAGPSPAADGTTTPVPPQTVLFENSAYAYAFVVVENPSAISLIPNFTKPKDMQTLIEEHECQSAINGGFYDTDTKPLGFFQSNGKTSGHQIPSDLVNGFFWAEASEAAVISTTLPNVNFRFALQTGPMLMFAGKPLPLAIRNDERARRMVAARTDDDRTIFLTVYKREIVFNGPLLADMPQIIASVSAQEKLFIVDAVNLDGGSASSFYHGTTKLSELTSVGSIFCIAQK